MAQRAAFRLALRAMDPAGYPPVHASTGTGSTRISSSLRVEVGRPPHEAPAEPGMVEASARRKAGSRRVGRARLTVIAPIYPRRSRDSAFAKWTRNSASVFR